MHGTPLTFLHWLYTAMCCAVACCVQVSDLQAILRDTNHNGFPVVRDSSVGQICLGLISRAHLLALLQRLIDSYRSGSSRGASPGISIAVDAEVTTTRQQLQQPLMAREVRGARVVLTAGLYVHATRALPVGASSHLGLHSACHMLREGCALTSIRCVSSRWLLAVRSCPGLS